MRATAGGVLLFGWICILWAQAPEEPVVSPRGVLNAFTLQPAPSVVGRGAPIQINGLRLGPAEGVTAPRPPWPTQIGDPPIRVLLNGQPIPIFSASLDRILAQVPWEAPAGLARIVVQRGDVRSRAAMIQIDAIRPAVRSKLDDGFGPVASHGSGGSLTLSAAGLGATDPRVETGEAPSPDVSAKPRDGVRVYVGGLPANATAALSQERVGEFDIQVEVPSGAVPGDVIALYAAGRAANFTTYRAASAAEVKFVPLPEGAPPLRSLMGSDLRGLFVAAGGARDDSGCYPGYIFDLAVEKATRPEVCLTAANRNAPSPFVVGVDGSALAAFAGPPAGDVQTGVSATIRLFDAANPGGRTVDLGAAASVLASAGGGDFLAQIPGTPPRAMLIDGQTGEARERTLLPAPGGAAQPLLNPKIDLGDGLTVVLSLTQVANGTFTAIVADNADAPTKARAAVLNRSGEVQGSRAFPEDWVPIVPPQAPGQPGQGGGAAQPGGAPAPGATPAIALRGRISTFYDAQLRNFYVLSRNGDNSRHGLVLFGENADPQAMPFPDSWFAAACTVNLDMFSLELARRLAIVAGDSAEISFRNPCPGTGFVLLDLNRRELAAVPLPGQERFNAARGAANDLNDFIYGSNTDPSQNSNADTLFVLDGVNASVTQLSLPPGITSFAALTPIRDMNALVAPAQADRADAGLAWFDLEAMQVRIFPVPEGFARLVLVGLFPATRKLVARGIKASGSQFLIYDTASGDLTIVPNPEGVAAVAQPAARVPAGQQPPGQGGMPAQPLPILMSVGMKSNTVSAVGYTADGKQAGVMAVRIP